MKAVPIRKTHTRQSQQGVLTEESMENGPAMAQAITQAAIAASKEDIWAMEEAAGSTERRNVTATIERISVRSSGPGLKLPISTGRPKIIIVHY